jgi:fatty-acyl-CoA synthase
VHKDFLGFHACYQPERVALIEASTMRQWSYQELDDTVSRLATVMRSLGVRKSDRVACIAKNSPGLVQQHLACSRLGAIFVPINWRLSATEVGELIAQAEPVLIAGDEQMTQLGVDGVLLGELQERAATAQPLSPIDLEPDRASLILFTSGTSGQPKGALLNETSLVETGINFSILGRVDHESRFLCDAPMFHVIGLVANVRPALMRGGCIVVSDGFDAQRTLRRLGDDELRISHYFCVPQMAAALRSVSGFDPAALRGLTGLFTGGAPHAPADILRWLDDGIVVADGFGMSETGTVFGMPVDAELIRQCAGSVGIATPRVHVRIVNEDGKPLPPGESGELQLRGRNLLREYWRKPAETAAAMTADGWFRTGDIARANAQGFHWIVDRMKDMFISGGENVYPAEIEAALAAHQDIVESAVIGVPDSRWGEVGHLFVVPTTAGRIDESELQTFLESRLARYKIPKHISCVDALPRNSAGKLLKLELRKLTEDTAMKPVTKKND